MNWYEDYGVNVPEANDEQKDLYRIFDDFYDSMIERTMGYWEVFVEKLRHIRYLV